MIMPEPLFAGFALKLILNAISTGANIMKGKVFRNTMINLTVANDKVCGRFNNYSVHPVESGIILIIMTVSVLLVVLSLNWDHL